MAALHVDDPASNIQCDTQYEVKRLVMMPTSNVTAKPRIGPDPYE